MKPSHDAAQKKVWKAEIRTLEASRKKVIKDCDSEIIHRVKAVKAADKKLREAERDLKRAEVKAAKVKPRALADIESRLAVLRGRLTA
jgi:tryptophanyl-tRNA synthetase